MRIYPIIDYIPLEEKYMSKFFTLNWLDIKNALVFGVLTALVVIVIEIINAKTIFGLDWKTLANDGVIAFLGVFVSLLKSLLTTKSGTIAGIKVQK